MDKKKLTKRELDVLSLIAEKGLSNIETAKRLRLAESTVKNHLIRIYRKLNIASDRQAIAHYYKNIKHTKEDLN